MTQLVNVRTFPLVDGRRVLPDDVVYIGRGMSRVGLPQLVEQAYSALALARLSPRNEEAGGA